MAYISSFRYQESTNLLVSYVHETLAYSDVPFGSCIMSSYQLYLFGEVQRIRTKAFVPSRSSSLDPHQHSVAQ